MAADGGQGSSGNTSAAADFEHLPYPSLPHRYSHPAHLAALAHLHGLTAPDIATARVLEIGCASGGNVIPLAARFPRMRVAGFDLSARHIADGVSRVQALGLANMDLRQGDVLAPPFKGETFDFIICHGLYSWVPPEAQSAVLRLMRDCLAPNGVAAISYNVLPGWHLRRVIRDICLHYAGTHGLPKDRVARARAALNDIAKTANEAQPYGAMLRLEADRLVRQPSAYILGEFLAENNRPCSYTEFAVEAAAHGLAFLCEADLNSGSTVSHQSVERQTEAEQRLDFVTGRPFRRSLLVRTPVGPAEPPSPMANRMRGLHILGSQSQKGRKSASALLTPALGKIAAAYPNSVSVNDILKNSLNADAGRLESELLDFVVSDGLQMTTLPIEAGRATADRPRVSALNRLEAASGQPWLTSLHHDAVPITPLRALIANRMDGRLDRTALAGIVSEACQRDPERAGGLTPEAIVTQTLAYFELNGVLEPAGMSP